MANIEAPPLNQSRLQNAIGKYRTLVRQDIRATYSRDLHEWLIIAPVIGVVTGLAITLVAETILHGIWPRVLQLYLAHWALIVPGVTAGFIVAGLIMQYLTPNPDEHSTEEVIRSYHEHQGDIQMRYFIPKLLAAVATVGFGGSAALEGPSIYGGGALGSWLWSQFKMFRRDPRNRRIMLIAGAAAGMAAVFRAPLTGIIFAIEMPYKDDLAHEALLPSLIASVVSYVTLAAFLGPGPIFDFGGGSGFSIKDLFWSALLGAGIGLIAMGFTITFRRARTFCVQLSISHWVKMAIGGVLTGFCGLAFLAIYHGTLAPIGPNYEAVQEILQQPHSSTELVVFSGFKLCATLFSLAVGGVSAMFVPLFLTGGALGVAFAHSIVRTPDVDLYAAVGMAAFIAGGYKAPLTAVVFVAEATGGHAFIIPALIGAAVAYAVSGESSVSGDQRLHEAVKVAELWNVPVRDVMRKQMITVDASANLLEFSATVNAHESDLHTAYPVFENGQPIGVIAMWSVAKIAAERWAQVSVGELADRYVNRISPDCDLMEALRLLTTQNKQHMLFVISPADGALEGIVTHSDLLAVLNVQREKRPAPVRHH